MVQLLDKSIYSHNIITQLKNHVFILYITFTALRVFDVTKSQFHKHQTKIVFT